MINDKRIAVVMPAYNAEKTLHKTYHALPFEVVDTIILVDDASDDGTLEASESLPDIQVFRHEENRGYGGNQKTCYQKAIDSGADIIVMVHPDYQYQPELSGAMAFMIAYDVYDCVLGSRILGSTALRGGMPLYKYIANRCLTLFQNLLLGCKLSEYHTGFRAFSRELVESLPLEENSEDFLFDNQMLVQIIDQGYRIGEISCPTRYEAGSSSISFMRSVKYGLGVIRVTLAFLLHRSGLRKNRLFRTD